MTLAYAAPEQRTGKTWRENPFAVDAWAVGVMLLELLSGKLPLYDISTQQLRYETPRWLNAPGGSAEEKAIARDLWQLAVSLTAIAPIRRPTIEQALLSAVFERELSTPQTSVSTARSLGTRFQAVRALLQKVRERERDRERARERESEREREGETQERKKKLKNEGKKRG
jgi:serine/threonine protein kinase